MKLYIILPNKYATDKKINISVFQEISFHFLIKIVILFEVELKYNKLLIERKLSVLIF